MDNRDDNDDDDDKKRIFTPAASALSNSRANIGQAWEIIIMDDGDTLISWRW